jgi:hypothetical protein
MDSMIPVNIASFYTNKRFDRKKFNTCPKLR